MSRYKKLGKNFGLLTVGSFASSLLGFLFIPLYTSVLSTEEYGISDLISVTISLLFPVFTLVISEAILRFSLDKQNDKKQIFSIGFYTTGIGCIVVLLLSPIIKWTALADYYWYFVIYFIVQAFYTTFAQFVKGQEKVRQYAIGGLLNSATVIFSNLLFLLVFEIGLTGYLMSLILGHLVTIIYYIIVSQAWTCLVALSRINKTLLISMLSYSCPMILNSVSWWISNSSDKYMLSYFCGVGANGIYSVAYKIPSMLAVITGLFISAWQISAVEDFNSESSIRFYNNVGNKYIALNVIISGWLIALTRILARVLFAVDYYEAWRITPILIMAYVFNTMSSFYGTIYTSAKKTKMLLYSTLIASLSNIVMNFLFIPFWGGVGAAIATMVSYGLIWIIRVKDSSKIMRLYMNWKKISVGFFILLIEIILLSINNWKTDILCFGGAIAISLLNVDTCKEVWEMVNHKMGLQRK